VLNGVSVTCQQLILKSRGREPCDQNIVDRPVGRTMKAIWIGGARRHRYILLAHNPATYLTPGDPKSRPNNTWTNGNHEPRFQRILYLLPKVGH